MKTVLIIFLIIETIAHIVAMHELYKILTNALKDAYGEFMQKCVNDIEYRNRFASKIYFFQDMGPNISAFSFISIFTSQKEAVIALIIVFLIGYNMKEQSRRFKNIFYNKVKERSQKCQLEQ
jgi:hypothetical protein